MLEITNLFKDELSSLAYLSDKYIPWTFTSTGQ